MIWSVLLISVLSLWKFSRALDLTMNCPHNLGTYLGVELLGDSPSWRWLGAYFWSLSLVTRFSLIFSPPRRWRTSAFINFCPSAQRQAVIWWTGWNYESNDSSPFKMFSQAFWWQLCNSECYDWDISCPL